MLVRQATPADAAALAGIYNQGIDERSATFETTLRSDEDILGWFDGVHPIVVVISDGSVIAFARSHEYSSRECYAGVFEFAVYTEFSHRRRGAALLAMRELITQARAAGAWKLTSRIFIDNEPSRMLVASLGFREVGIHLRHAKLDGHWRDVVAVEKFLAPIGGEGSIPPPPRRAPREQILVALRAADASGRLHALDSARSLIDVYRKVDQELLDGVANAFFASKLHEPGARARFVEVFRAYASISREASRAIDTALFARLGRLSLALDLDAFYEATFVVKQVAFGAGDAERASDRAMYRPRLLEWIKEAIELPRAMRGRISPGNLTSLLMTLALAASEGEEQKREITELSALARARQHVATPSSMRPPPPPPPPPVPEAAPPPPAPAALPPPVEVSVESGTKRKPRARRTADPTRPKKKRRAKT